MARVKLQLPEKFIFSTEIPVRITDLNYGNHLANDKLLGIIHETRVRFLESIGCTEMDVYGAGIILSDSVVIYKGQGFYNDLLKVEIAVSDIHKFGCDIFYKLTNTNSGVELARAKTGILFFNYEKQKLMSTPDKFYSILIS
ncbi:MAG: thioesterase family protein [Victivallales bacterium]|nr:thioesterase family protein [Victivallales bacterium]